MKPVLTPTLIQPMLRNGNRHPQDQTSKNKHTKKDGQHGSQQGDQTKKESLDHSPYGGTSQPCPSLHGSSVYPTFDS
jgi:hypothetical protein